MVGLGIGAWVVATPKAPERRSAQVVPPQPAGKHLTGKVQFDVLAKLLADDRRSAQPGEWLRELADRDGQVHWVSCGDTTFRNNKALLYELARLENKLP